MIDQLLNLHIRLFLMIRIITWPVFTLYSCIQLFNKKLPAISVIQSKGFFTAD